MSKFYNAICKIIPRRLIYKNKMYAIEYIESDYIVDKYRIELDNQNRILNIFVDCDHPNSDPVLDEFCMAVGIQGKYISYDLIGEIEKMIETYNLNHSYFSVWSYIKYGPYSNEEYLKRREKEKKSIKNKMRNSMNYMRNIGIEII